MQVAPVLHQHQHCRSVARLCALLDQTAAGQRWRILVCILGIVGGDGLIEAADIRRPVVTQVEAKRAACAADIGPVHIMLAEPRIVDIAAVADRIAGQSQGVATFAEGEIGGRGNIAARRPMLDQRNAGRGDQRCAGRIRRLRNHPDNAAQRSGPI